MNQIDGSYLLHEFGKRIISNLQQYKNGKCLGQLFDDINNYRHNMGKRQTLNIFNDNTRYLKLVKNEKRYNMNKEGNDEMNNDNDNNTVLDHESMRHFDSLFITRRKT